MLLKVSNPEQKTGSGTAEGAIDYEITWMGEGYIG